MDTGEQNAYEWPSHLSRGAVSFVLSHSLLCCGSAAVRQKFIRGLLAGDLSFFRSFKFSGVAESNPQQSTQERRRKNSLVGAPCSHLEASRLIQPFVRIQSCIFGVFVFTEHLSAPTWPPARERRPAHFYLALSSLAGELIFVAGADICGRRKYKPPFSLAQLFTLALA